MRSALWVGAAATLVGLSRYFLGARVPDDWDGIGFVRALDEFDLARFQPHFPGYPVYVALGRIAHLALRDPLAAAIAVSAAAAAATSVGLWCAVRRLSGGRAASAAMALYAVSALPFVLGGAALSDGTATALATLAFLALAEESPLIGGVILGLMLGARASYFPLALSWWIVLLAWRRRGFVRALVGTAFGTLAWLTPLVAVVGARSLVALGRTHLHGHFAVWGGTIATRPRLAERLVALLRGLFFDGLCPRPWALGALAVIVLLAWRFRRPSRSGVLLVLAIAGPYALWTLLGQNILEQPRHVLPLVIVLIGLLGLLLAPHPRLTVAAVAVVLAAALPEAIDHQRTAPAAAQLARYVATNYRPGETALFGGRSIRFLNQLSSAPPGYERGWLSEVDVTLERLDVLPKHVLVTSEVEVDPRRMKRLKCGPRFCREGLLDRAQPCLDLCEYAIFPTVAP